MTAAHVTRPRRAPAVTVRTLYDNGRPRRIVAVRLRCTTCGAEWDATQTRGQWTDSGLTRQARAHRCGTDPHAEAVARDQATDDIVDEIVAGYPHAGDRP